jgi:hypothetical protein
MRAAVLVSTGNALEKEREGNCEREQHKTPKRGKKRNGKAPGPCGSWLGF